MLNTLLITPDDAVAVTLTAFAQRTGTLLMQKVIPRQVQAYELARLCNSFAPELLFIDLRTEEALLQLPEAAPTLPKPLAIVAFSTAEDFHPAENPAPEYIDAWLDLPITEEQFHEACEQAVQKSLRVRHETLFAVLPAKAGCGASTTALHLGRALTEETGKECLVIDADMRSGLLATMLNVTPKAGMREAVDGVTQLQPTFWNSLVLSFGQLHLLPCSPVIGRAMPMWTDYYQLMRFAVPRYRSTVVDLPEVVNEATVEVARAAAKVLVVMTSELASITLARRRVEELERWGLGADRVELVLNRHVRTDLSVEETEQMIGRRVAGTLPNDYQSLQRAAVEGGFVLLSSPLGEAYINLARHLLGKEPIELKPQGFRAGLKALLR